MTGVPTVLGGRYALFERLDGLGIEHLHRALDRQTGRWCTVKLGEAGHRGPDLREAEILGALDHPNLARRLDAGTEDGVPYLVLEPAEGSVLDWVSKHGPMPPRMAVSIAIQICRGIAHANAAGIVHGDLRADDVLVSEDGTCKVTGFGRSHPTPTPTAARSEYTPPSRSDRVLTLGILVVVATVVWWGLTM